MRFEDNPFKSGGASKRLFGSPKPKDDILVVPTEQNELENVLFNYQDIELNKESYNFTMELEEALAEAVIARSRYTHESTDSNAIKWLIRERLRIGVKDGAIISLNMNNQDLFRLPKLPSTLESLHCENNLLTTLPEPLPPKLKFLSCGFNKLTELPELPESLTELHATMSQFTPETYEMLDKIKGLKKWIY